MTHHISMTPLAEPGAAAPLIWEKEDPRALINLVPDSLAKVMDQTVFTRPELFDKDERELYKYLRSINAGPTPTDNRLRLKFWMEYDRVMSEGHSTLNMQNVVAGVCSRDYFLRLYINSPTRLCWMLTPPAGYAIRTEEALDFGLEQLRDILEQPHVDEKGKVDVKLAETKAKIVAMLDQRVKGAVVQKSMQLNVSTSAKSLKTIAETAKQLSMKELEEKLNQIKRKELEAQNLPIDVKADSVE